MDRIDGKIHFVNDRERDGYVETHGLNHVEEKADPFTGRKTTTWTNGRGYYLQGKEKAWCYEELSGVYTEYREWLDWDEIHERWRKEGKE